VKGALISLVVLYRSITAFVQGGRAAWRLT